MLKWKAWAILLLAMVVAVSGAGIAEMEPETVEDLLQIDEIAFDDAQPIELDAGLEELPEDLLLEWEETDLEAAMVGDGEVLAEAVEENGDAAEAEPGLTLDAPFLTLGVGERYTLKPTLSDESAAETVTYKFKSSDRTVVKAGSDGVVKAKAVGQAKVTVKASNGLSASCDVTVMKAPRSITLNRTEVTLAFDAASGAGTTCRLTATLSKGSASAVRYSGYDESVVEVTEDGLIVPCGLGSTTVKAKTFNGKTASAEVRVLPGPEGFELNASELCLTPGDKFTLKPALPEGTAGSFSFSSDAPAVAKVNARSGRITAVSRGEATITAVCFNGIAVSCRVEVLLAPDEILLDASRLRLGAGESRALTVRFFREDGEPSGGMLKYSSSKRKYVEVSADGVVTGKKKGSANITVTGPGGVKAVCKVEVLNAPQSLTLSVEKSRLAYDPESGEGERTSLTATLPPDTASAIRYSDYDPDVVAVSPDGEVTAVGVGGTWITATAFNGVQARCTVRVYRKGERPQVENIAHRGGMGYWPENTLEAFRNAASTGADAVELDVHTTADGVQVVNHNAFIRAKGKKYTLAKHRYSKLKKLKRSLCTLDDALEVISAAGLNLYLEMKDTANPEACVAAVRRHGMQGRTVYISFEAPLLQRVRRAEPEARLGYLFKNVPMNLDALIDRLEPFALCQQQGYLTLSNLRSWQNRGLQVNVWVLNTSAAIERYLEWGVDSITSDYPRMVTKALQK